MTPSKRLLLTVLLVALLGAAGAMLFAYRSGAVSGGSAFDVATTGDLQDLFATRGAGDSTLAGLALRKLESSYYKPIEPQTPIAAESQALRDFLSDKKIRQAQLPGETASGDPAQDGKRAADVLAYAQDRYAAQLGTSGRDDLADVALRAIMTSVRDPYTVYLSPREIQGLDESLSGGNFGGIGVYIYQLKDGRMRSAAHRGDAGGARGHEARRNRGYGGRRADPRADDRPRHADYSRRGRHDGPSHGAPVRRPVARALVPDRSRDHPRPDRPREDGRRIDYIRLSDFGTTSGDEMRKALLAGKAAGARGYIFDLRNNGGGLLDAAVSISSLFIPQGTIVSTIRRDGQTTSESALGDAIGGLQPLVILVNKYTASASEITSGALQDYHLATLVGTHTFGKGVVQSIFPLPDQGALKITTARYVTPAGRDIQHHGIEPDVVVEQDPNPSLIDTPADKQLAAAKARLQNFLR